MNLFIRSLAILLILDTSWTKLIPCAMCILPTRPPHLLFLCIKQSAMPSPHYLLASDYHFLCLYQTSQTAQLCFPTTPCTASITFYFTLLHCFFCFILNSLGTKVILPIFYHILCPAWCPTQSIYPINIYWMNNKLIN